MPQRIAVSKRRERKGYARRKRARQTNYKKKKRKGKKIKMLLKADGRERKRQDHNEQQHYTLLHPRKRTVLDV